MDGGSGHNILCVSTLDNMGILRSRLCPSPTLFHGVVPGMEALPIGLYETSARKHSPSKWWGFSGTYHAILRRLAYAKFMVVPNYTYIKLKIPGPKGVITVGTMF
jgi:hypothetical protein